MLSDIFYQHVLYRTVHALNHAITLWVVWHCSRFLDTEEVTHFLKQLGFEVLALVSVDTFRCPEPGNNLVHQLLCDCLCLLIRGWECLGPLHEVVSNSQELRLTRFCSWKGTHDVQSNPLKWVTWTAVDKGCSSWLLGDFLLEHFSHCWHQSSMSCC